MGAKATDPFSGGRQFVEHYAIPEWNVVPVTPTIETQYTICIGTAHVQRRHGGDGLSIVTGGDAGAAEGDLHVCLNWSSRPGAELPVLIIVTHNRWGISTECTTVQSNPDLNELATPFKIRNAVVDGNDVEVSWNAIADAMNYIRAERKPFMLQANVSRLYGHSSASGANRVDERDCIPEYEARLIREGVMTREECDAVWEGWRTYCKQALEQVRKEPYPDPSDIWTHIFAEPVRT
jgi:2-oxoisovalerate dehydrogenase E1 component alpha subunit